MHGLPHFAAVVRAILLERLHLLRSAHLLRLQLRRRETDQIMLGARTRDGVVPAEPLDTVFKHYARVPRGHLQTIAIR